MQPQMQGMMPQQEGMEGQQTAAQPSMQGMMPQQGMMQPQMQGMMPQQGMMQPQMMGMQPMMGMPQFMGYDPTGNPIYMQMVPQMVGYDAYGNPMYSMMPMQSYGMPQVMPQMQQGMAQPQMQGMPQNPQMTGMAVAQPQAVQPPVQEAAAPQESAARTSAYYSEMPISAESLMNEDENAEEPAPPADLPNEAELLDQIFSDRPKQHTMSTGTVPSSQTFSISLAANEITSVGEEKPAEQETSRSSAPEQKTKPKKQAKKTAAQGEKKPLKVVSPDEFFEDNRRKSQKMVGVRVVEELDDDAMEEQLAAMEGGKKKSRRSMEAADKNMDAEAALENPAVEAAAQAILDEESALSAMNAMQQKFNEMQNNISVQKEDVNHLLDKSWPEQQSPLSM